ncbi:MAG: DUF4956 domain-containing protein, partial [Bacteroidota bacterium]
LLLGKIQVHMKFEDLLLEFSGDIGSHQQFLFNALLTASLSYLLGRFYMRYGEAVSNRKKFGNNFMLLALSTMLIIYIVKNSIALSLGLVGALSIVRFRAAIKEPEELIYLFFVIGIGLGMGANQTIITLLAFVLIISLLLIRNLLIKKTSVKSPENMFLNISSKVLSAEQINKTISEHFVLIELKRMDQRQGQLDISYIIETEDVNNIIKAKDALLKQSPDINFSFIEQRNLSI